MRLCKGRSSSPTREEKATALESSSGDRDVSGNLGWASPPP